MRKLTNLPLATLGLALVALALSAFAAAPAYGGACTVGTTAYPSLESAIRNPACAPINVLAGTYRENVSVNRSVSILGAGSGTTTIEGRVWIQGATSDVIFDGFTVAADVAHVSGCWFTVIDARNGSTFDSINVVARHNNVPAGDCRIFADGFNLGSAQAWSDIIN